MSAQVNRIVVALERAAERAVVKIALDCRANLVAPPQRGGTPIDTGWASALWHFSVGQAGALGVGLDGQDGALVATASAEATASAARLLSYKLGQGAVFLANNAPYIGRLNAGWSDQAPAGFVERAVAKALTVDFRGVVA